MPIVTPSVVSTTTPLAFNPGPGSSSRVIETREEEPGDPPGEGAADLELGKRQEDAGAGAGGESHVGERAENGLEAEAVISALRLEEARVLVGPGEFVADDVGLGIRR